MLDSSPQGTTLACHDDIDQRDMEKKASVCVDNCNFDLGFGNGPTTMTLYIHTFKEEARSSFIRTIPLLFFFSVQVELAQAQRRKPIYQRTKRYIYRYMASLMTFLVVIVLALLHLTQSATSTHTKTGTYTYQLKCSFMNFISFFGFYVH